MGYKIEDIEGVGPAYAQKLSAAGIKTTTKLLTLCCDAKGRAAVASRTGLSEQVLLKWANLADLMRISGVGGEYSELLEAAGVDTVKELRNRNPVNTAAKMKDVNAQKKLTRSVPSSTMVERWVEQAKNLSPVITH